jgi:predicted ATPase/DNA-binding SARP family transcriptional activator
MTDTMARLTISLFGTFEVALAGEPVTTFEYDKVRALLTYLAVESDRPHRREALAGLLWPDQPERKARHSLSQTLFTLRRTIGDRRARPSFLDITAQTLQFNPLSDYELDVTQFSTLLAACQTHDHDQLAACESCLERLQQAIALYRGSLLEGFSLGDSPAFEEWLVLNRERYHRLAIGALGRLTDSYEARGLYEAALEYAWRQLELDPWRETTQRQLMRLLALSGQKEAALVQFDSCRKVLQTELGLEPSAETVALAETIRQGTLEAVGIGPHRPPVPDQTVFTPHNLPPQPTPFVGRDQELAQISAHLADPDCRLLTLVGPGGIGKTRLAVQAAAELIRTEAFPQGVCFVALAPVSSPEFIISAIADALNFSFFGREEPKVQLLNYLCDKKIVLILDNFEHLLTGVDLVSDMLDRNRNLKLLVTSRERLNLREEWLLDVRGLLFPAVDQLEHIPAETYSAVQLFLRSAARLDADFALSAANEPHVVHICQLVEGMPLAVELAASWIRTLTCQQIAQEIEQGLGFLATSLRDVPERHRSMQAVFEHSWQLLSPAEKQLFRRMAVFRGGFRKSAAEQVTGATLSLLSALVDKSFLRRTRPGRYELHELLRQFAVEKLAELPDEEVKVQDRHCRYYMAFLEQREQALNGPAQKEVLAEIATEIENIRAAWRWAITHQKIEEIDKSVAGFFRFYFRRSWYQEGQETFRQAAIQLDQAVGLEENARRLLLGKLWARQGVCLNYLASFSEGMELLRQSLAILRQVGPAARAETAFALMFLGDAAFDNCEYSQAREWLRESLAICRETGDQWGLAFSLFMLDAVAYALGDYAEAKKLAQESLATFTQLGDQWGIAFAQNDVGLVAYFMGEYAEARQRLQESISVADENGDTWVLLCALNNLARVTLAVGDYSAAAELLQRHNAITTEFSLGKSSINLSLLSQLARIQGEYQQASQLGQASLICAREVNIRRSIGRALCNLGTIAYLQGEYDEAEQLLKESLAIRREIGYRRGVAESLGHLGKVALAQAELEQAERYFYDALQMAMDVGAKAIALDILLGVALLLGKKAEYERAVELLALVLHHPSSEQENKDQAKGLLGKLEAKLPVLVAAAALASGQARSVDEVAAELLENRGWRILVKY